MIKPREEWPRSSVVNWERGWRRGVKLGKPLAVEKVRLNTVERNKARDRHFDKVLKPHITKARKNGVIFYKDLVVYLNERGVKTWKGQEWTIHRVDNALRRQRRRLAEQALIRKRGAG